MMDNELEKQILEKLPYSQQFCFVDGLTSIDDETVEGHYTFSGDEPAIQGHFSDNPVIPGVILLEVMGQIGMVSHLIYLLDMHTSDNVAYPVLANIESEYVQSPKIGEKLIVKGSKIYFRNGILKSEVVMKNEENQILVQATIIVKSSA